MKFGEKNKDKKTLEMVVAMNASEPRLQYDPTEPTAFSILDYAKRHRWVDLIPVAGFASWLAYGDVGEPSSGKRLLAAFIPLYHLGSGAYIYLNYIAPHLH